MISELTHWLGAYRTELATLGSISILLLMLTVLATPMLVSRLPIDYFRPQKNHRARRGFFGSARQVLQNFAAAFFVLMGMIMMILPGPGLVCFIVGLSLSEFSGKQRFLTELVRRYPNILTSLNWFRRKSGKEQLLPP